MLAAPRTASFKLLGRSWLTVFAALFGFVIWFPAIGVPVGSIFMQPADLLVVLSYPLILRRLPQVPPRTLLIIILSMLSVTFATLNSGNAMVLLYYACFIAPFMLFIGIMCSHEGPRREFLRAFLVGALLSGILFLAQILLGAQALDFRTNRSFSFAPQYERGFALFPEVSTFATHTIYMLGVLVVLWRAGKFRPLLGKFRIIALVSIALVCLLLSKSSSVILVAPMVLLFAYFKGQSLTTAGLLGAVILSFATVVFLQFYISEFYIDRATSGAIRSIGLRGISILSGLSVLGTGDFFGVGLGNNHMVTERAQEVARDLGFSLILLPKGINSFVVTRIFEEGWPAVLMFALTSYYLVKAAFGDQQAVTIRALVVLAFASFLVSLLVTGYRGLFMNWFWLAAVPSLLPRRHMADKIERYSNRR